MNNILKWVKLESIMIATFSFKGESAPKFNRYPAKPIGILEHSC